MPLGAGSLTAAESLTPETQISNPAWSYACGHPLSDPGGLTLAAAFGKTLPRLDDGKKGLPCVLVCIDTFAPLFMAGVHFPSTQFPAYFITGFSCL